MTRRALGWSAAWLLCAAFYLLLIDNISLPELIVGAGAAALAASGLELVREQGVVLEKARWRWLLRAVRVLAKVPVDIVLVSFVAVRGLLRRDVHAGEFRAVPFRCGEQKELEQGRHAMALGFGSLAPNTIVVGIDEQRELVLAHQLVGRGGREAIDVLELG